MHYGYVRLSSLYTDPQEQITSIGLPSEAIYIDEYPRPELYFPQREKLLRKVQEGDTIHIMSIDRFFMNVGDLKLLLTALLEKKVTLHSHSENLIIDGDNLDDFAKTFISFSFILDTWQRNVQREIEEESEIEEELETEVSDSSNGDMDDCLEPCC
ncbi:MAG: recombinase family protein [Desulfovibrionaceae bacterium]|nr:recombinase family protein [Desulfovibrionaceae bacterium]